MGGIVMEPRYYHRPHGLHAAHPTGEKMNSTPQKNEMCVELRACLGWSEGERAEGEKMGFTFLPALEACVTYFLPYNITSRMG